MWIYKNQELTEAPPEYIGFIYLITNLSNGRLYIGKKKFWNKSTKYKVVTQKNGTKKKKKIRGLIESDWKDYYSSSEELISDVKNVGSDLFKREILYLCKTESELTYIEAREQFDRRVLEDELYYNGWIMVRVRKSNIMKKISSNI